MPLHSPTFGVELELEVKLKGPEPECCLRDRGAVDLWIPADHKPSGAQKDWYSRHCPILKPGEPDHHPSSVRLAMALEQRFAHWEVHQDRSVAASPGYHSVEVVMKPKSAVDFLRRRNEDDPISPVMNFLAGFGCRAPQKSAALHVHLGTHGNLEPSFAHVKLLCLYYVKFQRILDTVVPPNRRRGHPYCLPLPDSPDTQVQLLRATTLRSLQDLLNPPIAAQCNAQRYYKVNLSNLRPGGSNTIEVRHQASSLDSERVTGWVETLLLMMQYSSEDAQQKLQGFIYEPQAVDLQTEFFQLFYPQNARLQEWFLRSQASSAECKGCWIVPRWLPFACASRTDFSKASWW